MKLMEFNGYQNQPLYLDVHKVMGVSVKTTEPPVTLLMIQAGQTSEDWHVRESLNSVLAKCKD